MNATDQAPATLALAGTRIVKLEERQKLLVDEVAELREDVRQIREEASDQTADVAAMVASMRVIFKQGSDARAAEAQANAAAMAAQTHMLSRIEAGQAQRGRRDRLSWLALALFTLVCIVGLVMKVPTELTLALAGAVGAFAWRLIQPTGTPGTSVPPPPGGTMPPPPGGMNGGSRGFPR